MDEATMKHLLVLAKDRGAEFPGDWCAYHAFKKEIPKAVTNEQYEALVKAYCEGAGL